MVDNFGVKYNGKEHAQHLVVSLEAAKYRVKTDWKGKKYIGITLDWDSKKCQVPGFCRTFISLMTILSFNFTGSIGVS